MVPSLVCSHHLFNVHSHLGWHIVTLGLLIAVILCYFACWLGVLYCIHDVFMMHYFLIDT